MTPAFKNGFADELQKIAVGPAVVALGARVLPSVIKGIKGLAADAGTNMLGSFMSRSRKPPQGTGMTPPVGGVQ